MKLWAHINDMLKEKRTIYNHMHIIDINFSFYTSKNIQLILRLQDVQHLINRITDNARSGVYKES